MSSYVIENLSSVRAASNHTDILNELDFAWAAFPGYHLGFLESCLKFHIERNPKWRDTLCPEGQTLGERVFRGLLPPALSTEFKTSRDMLLATFSKEQSLPWPYMTHEFSAPTIFPGRLVIPFETLFRDLLSDARSKEFLAARRYLESVVKIRFGDYLKDVQKEAAEHQSLEADCSICGEGLPPVWPPVGKDKLPEVVIPKDAFDFGGGRLCGHGWAPPFRPDRPAYCYTCGAPFHTGCIDAQKRRADKQKKPFKCPDCGGNFWQAEYQY